MIELTKNRADAILHVNLDFPDGFPSCGVVGK
jgi:hypothetical protein